jgi:hypothetical protein
MKEWESLLAKMLGHAKCTGRVVDDTAKLFSGGVI